MNTQTDDLCLLPRTASTNTIMGSRPDIGNSFRWRKKRRNDAHTCVTLATMSETVSIFSTLKSTIASKCRSESEGV